MCITFKPILYSSTFNSERGVGTPAGRKLYTISINLEHGCRSRYFNYRRKNNSCVSSPSCSWAAAIQATTAIQIIGQNIRLFPMSNSEAEMLQDPNHASRWNGMAENWESSELFYRPSRPAGESNYINNNQERLPSKVFQLPHSFEWGKMN